MNEQNKMTRRQVVAGLGATMAAAAVSPAVAAADGLRKDPAGPAKITDPTAIYPKPPIQISAPAMARTSKQNGPGAGLRRNEL